MIWGKKKQNTELKEVIQDGLQDTFNNMTITDSLPLNLTISPSVLSILLIFPVKTMAF